MRASTFSHTVPDGTVLNVNRWLPDGAATAVVQVAHGMAEHGARYAYLGERLAAEGYAVYASDHRGHGGSAAGPDEVGHLGDVSGFADTVDDLAALTEHLRAEHPGVPVVLLGHSFGSFLARAYAARYGDRIDALIISGTSGDPGLLGRVGLRLAGLEARVRGPRARSALMEALVIRPYNRPFRPNRTDADWLTRDEAEVDAFVADELSGVRATAGFYRDMLTGLLWVSQLSTVEGMPADLPVRIVGGSADPLGGTEAAVEVAGLMLEAGVRDVTVRIWPEARHEVLNETNRAEVVDDLLAWLDAHV